MPEAPPRIPPNAVVIYTDGGADPNPGPGGWGAVLLHPASGSAQELHGGEPKTTNNRMELTAAIRALEALRQPCRVEMHTDSQYLRRGVTEWLPGWIARGWRRKAGELQNEDLWRRLAEAAARHQVSWKWVKGHAGDRRNERADQLATLAIREQRARAAAAAGAAAGVEGSAAAPERPEHEAFLRVSMTPQGGGWAALVRRAPAIAPGAAGAAGPAGVSATAEDGGESA
ncbi:MAG: ribonuclease HI, partial [Acidobacteria bacterium]|nr:ribonuclease HI [Acidobacteriota bacterium]